MVHSLRSSLERKVKNVSDVLSVGQQVDVKLTEIDRMGRLNLSYIDAQPESAEKK